MKRVLLELAFDGTAYHGWQYQPNGLSVQQVVQQAVTKVLSKPTNITGCSRTDAGVHARSFFCHIDCDDSIPHSAFLRGLNSCLPTDISVISCRDVSPDFHARYSCKKKNYTYYFYFGTKDPFSERYALRLADKPDISLMNAFCGRIVGKHDFYGFSSSGRTVEDTVRCVYDCSAFFKDSFLCFDITADGFLYNMVRILAGTALEVGYGKLQATVADRIFETKNRSLGGNTLAPKGLFLNKVYY